MRLPGKQQEGPLVVQRDDPAHRLDGLLRIRAGEPVMPHFLEPGGQDVLQYRRSGSA